MTITEKAKEELKRIKETRKLEPGQCLRLAMEPVWQGEGNFGIVIDNETSQDSAIRFQGSNILVMDSLLVDHLKTAVLDFKESSHGTVFTLDVF